MIPWGAIAIGALITGLQTATLFIMRDLRSRVVRLEDRAMRGRWR